MAVKKSYDQFTIYKERHLVSNALELDEHKDKKEMPQEGVNSNEKPTLTYVGRVIEEKNQLNEVLINGF